MENYNWINSRERFNVPQTKREPKVDELVSKAVGKKIYDNDPRVLKTVVGWKKKSNKSDDVPDNFLEDPKKIAELKEALK